MVFAAEQYLISRRRMAALFGAVTATGFALPLIARADGGQLAPNSAGAQLPEALSSEAKLVSTQNELKAAISAAQPGDAIVLADGEWRDAEIDFSAEGTQQAPIILAAQTPGGVIMSGSSRVFLSGAYLIACGLVFRGGATTSEVIRFGSGSSITHHCRVTNCTIEDYSGTGDKRVNWVNLHGRHNRFDHNYVAGKSDLGVTVAVRLTTPGSDENYHSIDHNHFGPRPELEINGAETIQVGTGEYLHLVSGTIVENNLFEDCNGEAEIISVKTSQNTIRNNMFLRCKGSVTIRQGHENTVEDNIFLGEGVAKTGGVRITGKGQIVRNNLFVGLRGKGTYSALTLMNGWPNRDLRTYAPIVGATIENNSFFDCAELTFGALVSKDLSSAAQQTVFRNNLLVGTTRNMMVLLSSIDGISMENNAFFGSKAKGMDDGFLSLENAVAVPAEASAFMSPDAPSGIGFRMKDDFVTRKDVGVSYGERSSLT